jgi:acetyltransferase-like isoleucine patch superfamily enzyme
LLSPTARVHETADIEPDVAIGDGTSIWHRAQIRTGARIGRESIVGRDAFIDEGVVIGDRVKIQNGALVYHGVTVGSGVFIGPGAILTNDRSPRAVTPTGDLARADDWTVTATHLADGCSIGAGAVVVAGCDIGTFALVGAGSVVTHRVEDYALVVGNPARRIGWVCACGDRLTDTDALTCARCGRHYEQTTHGLEERS